MNSNKGQLAQKLVPEALFSKYSDYEIVAESSYYKIFEATLTPGVRRYAIRALDLDSDYVKANLAQAATLFLQEVLCLCLRLESAEINAVKIENFCIDMEKKQIAFVMAAQVSLQCVLEEAKARKERPELDVDRLFKHLAADLDFLYHKLKYFSPDLSPENIFCAREMDLFFLGNWASASTIDPGQNHSLNHTVVMNQSGVMNTSLTLSHSRSEKYASPEVMSNSMMVIDVDNIPEAMAQDIFTLGLIGLEACGLDLNDWKDLSNPKLTAMEHNSILGKLSGYLTKIDCPEFVRGPVLQMLQKEPKTRVPLDDIMAGRWKRIRLAYSSFGSNRIGLRDVRSKETFEIQGAQLDWGGNQIV